MTDPSCLDRPTARFLALGVVALVVASLGYIHRDDLFPPEPDAVSADDPVAICFAQRSAEIDQMLAEGVINQAQSEQFKGRAEAFCVVQEGGGAGPPQ